jgi:iron complex outermembrane receptor protein
MFNNSRSSVATERRRSLVVFALIAFLGGGCASAGALEASSTPAPVLPEISVIGTTPLPGTRIDADKVPGNVQSVYSADLAQDGTASLIRALGARLSSVNIDDTLADPFQPDILYRGFEASPVLGSPQGLAVYQNGVRINEAFGDTVNWDLIPDIAIDRVDIVSSSPLYGLNALGGAMTLTMKNGFSFQGVDGELSGGSFNQRTGSAQVGINRGLFGVYAAARALDQDGWRWFSHDSLRQYYLDISLHEEGAAIDLSYARAVNQLFGQGAAPLQSLAISPQEVFTGPQSNSNSLDFVTLNASLDMTRALALQGVAYFRNLRQSLVNGNSTGYTSCTSPIDAGLLCQPGGSTPLANSAGGSLPDISNGGAQTIGENDFEWIHSQSFGGSVQLTGSQPLFAHHNQFALGASIDTARIDFSTATAVGLINPSLTVLPSGLFVYTPENTGYAATPVSLRATNHFYGFFATDTWDVSPALAITASGRYNIAEVDLSDQLGSDLNGINRFTHFNPALGGTYKLSANLTTYAGYSINNRAPTASEIECSDPLRPCLLPSSLAGDPPNLKQVISQTTELGMRGQRALADSGRLTWNAGVFRTTLDNDIYAVATSVGRGYFQNIGSTRRQGLELGMTYQDRAWSGYAQYSFIDATFRSPLTLFSPFNPFHDANGEIQVQPGDQLPGIPRQRFKAGGDYTIRDNWTVGGSFVLVTTQYYHGDESNQNAPMPGYHVLSLRSSYRVNRRFEIFGTVQNVFDARYATYGLFSDPTGVGAPGIPADAGPNDPRVDNRFQSPAAPRAVFGGVRITFE